jgi:predicted alpha/beta hydrolase family esterase
MNLTDVAVLTLPGYESSGPDHWQTHWECSHGFVRVEQDNWLEPRLDTWGARLSAAITAQTKPVILLPHSASSALVPIWAEHNPLAARVLGAFIVAPADTERADMLPVVAALGPMPRARLPFPSVLVASTNDPYCAIERAETFVRDWGSELRVLEGAGHINTASGHGSWTPGLAWFEAWLEGL